MDADIDPVFAHAARWLIAGVFALGLSHKLKSMGDFETVVRDYRVVPAAAAPLVARLVVFLEAVALVGLASRLWLPVAIALAAGLLMTYWIAIAINLARGRRDIDCGCFGPSRNSGSRNTLDGSLLVRNFVLVAITGFLVLPVASRELTWLDTITVTTAATAGLALYLAFDQLIANRPLVKGLLQ
jgi:uncharacterized membrane protein YphA (DoxX/SURF4 family)